MQSFSDVILEHRHFGTMLPKIVLFSGMLGKFRWLVLFDIRVQRSVSKSFCLV